MPLPSPPPGSPNPTHGAFDRPAPVALDTSGWKTYTSDRYGFTILYPSDWSSVPATKDWNAADKGTWPNPGWEQFLSSDTQIGIGVFSVPITPETTFDSWLATTCEGYTEPCSNIADRAVDVTMDGNPAVLVPFADDLQVFSVIGDRMWVIASGRPADEADSLRLVESFFSTMHILPGGSPPKILSTEGTPVSPAPS